MQKNISQKISQRKDVYTHKINAIPKFPLILSTDKLFSSWILVGTSFRLLLLISNIDRLGNMRRILLEATYNSKEFTYDTNTQKKITLTLSASSSSLKKSPSSSVVNWILAKWLLAKSKVLRLSKRRCLRWEHTVCKTVFLTDLEDCRWTRK